MLKKTRSWPKIIALSCGIIVTTVGLATFIGWVLGISSLKSVLPGIVTMKVNTSLGFIFSGLSLIFFVAVPGGILRKASVITAILVLLIGSLTAFEYVTNIGLGIDELVIKEDAGAVGTLSPGRMAPSTALCFTVFGAVLLLLNLGRGPATAQALALIICFLGLMNFIGYIYDVKSLYGIGRFTQMAVHTAIAFIFLGAGTIMARSDKGLAAIVTGKGLGSSVARRLLPVVIVVPLLIGCLRVLGERSGVFSSELGVGLVALAYIVLLSLSILFIASKINRDDVDRTKNLETLKDLSNRLRVSAEEWGNTFNAITDLVFIQDNNYTILNANKAFCEAMKMAPGEIVGKKCYHLLHGKDHPWPNCPMEKTIQDGKTHTEEVDDPNIGTLLSVTTSPILDKTGHGIGSVHIAKDITESKKISDAMRESEERHKAIYMSSMDAIMLLDDKGFTAANPSTLALFGCRDESEFTSHGPIDLSPQYQPDGQLSSVKAAEMIRIAMDKGSNFFEWTHKRTDGKEFFATVTLTRLVLGAKQILQANVRDISEHKKLEADIQKRIESLEKFQKITVDRELRMKELKTKIAELEKKLHTTDEK